MLNKSKSSALILSAICVLSFSLANGLVNILIPYLTTGNVQNVIADPNQLSKIEDILVLIAILLGLWIMLTAVGAYWIYRFFGDGYYGRIGALRWSLFGVLFALLLALPSWLLPETWGIPILLLKFLSVFAAFFIARKIIPVKDLRKNSSPKKQKTSTQRKKPG